MDMDILCMLCEYDKVSGWFVLPVCSGNLSLLFEWIRVAINWYCHCVQVCVCMFCCHSVPLLQSTLLAVLLTVCVWVCVVCVCACAHVRMRKTETDQCTLISKWKHEVKHVWIANPGPMHINEWIPLRFLLASMLSVSTSGVELKL